MSKTKPRAPKVMIIRHAEKPPEPPKEPPPFGVTHKGTQDKEALIVRGWQRAGALASFFDPPPNTLFQNPSVATPSFVYASKIEGEKEGGETGSEGEKKKVGSKSRRPQETVTPLVEKLGAGVTADFTFDKGDEKALAAAALSRGSVVLICWEHQDIPEIAKHIPVSPETPVPKGWPVDGKGHARFEVVWVFDLDQTSATYSFTQIPQRLLAGDSPD
jgi:hypothetical protein